MSLIHYQIHENTVLYFFCFIDSLRSCDKQSRETIITLLNCLDIIFSKDQRFLKTKTDTSQFIKIIKQLQVESSVRHDHQSNYITEKTFSYLCKLTLEYHKLGILEK